MIVPRPGDRRSARAETKLPAWPRVLVAIAHPDDESFGLGACRPQKRTRHHIEPTPPRLASSCACRRQHVH